MKVTKEFIDKNFSAIHLSFLQIVVFRQSLINKLLGGPVDSCIIQIVCWHHLKSLLSDNLNNQDIEYIKVLDYWNNSFGKNFSSKKLTLTLLSELSGIPLETVRRRVIQLERKNWIKYNAKTGVIYSPNKKIISLLLKLYMKKKKIFRSFI